MPKKKKLNDENSFDTTLDQIIELLESDEQQFIYLTGAAGTGKTTLIERVVDECGLRKIVVAPTGVAALNIGGLSLIHISEPTRLLSISYAVFCLKKKNKRQEEQ